ncbi:efflux transporter outer membrane subunit [Legionella sainthelensi]|uniref:efflux transporter outer membrane subunit n=1 Tax=Legionella sainthelensi TaxID=28087 RepID=UPI0021664EC2|nr:efflux transporter outer membrane subunit [Legionella sainthelensi]
MSKHKKDNWYFGLCNKLFNLCFKRAASMGAVLVFFLLSNCTVGPDYKRPTQILPQSYTKKLLGKKTPATATKMGEAQYFAPNKELPKQWWQLFHSKDLDDVVLASIQHNPTVTSAQESLSIALENAYAGKGALLPFVGSSFSPTYQQTAKILTSVLASNQYLYSLFTGQLYVSYTPDVFGGTRRQIESLVAQVEVQHFQLEATYLTLTTNVVNAVIQEAALREQITVTQHMIAAQKKLLAILKQQLKLGDTALSNVATQQAALAASEAMLPPLEKQLAIQRDLLNALTGRFPDDQNTPQFRLSSLHLPRELPLSVPAKLLENRPDIRAAEAQMHAANALIGVAIANRLPNVTINSSGTNLGSAATTIGTLLQSNTQFWAMAGIITQPIFDAGTLRHKQRAAEANYRQAAADYRATVINAFQNVADTLKAIQSDAISLKTASNAERAAFTSLNIARRQFALGDSSTVGLILNEITYQQARLNLIQAQANRLADTVALFQALGGGWQSASESKNVNISK